MSIEERRLEIMRSLSDVLKEKHLSSLTMQDIATRLGMAKGNLYNYFKSKQDLLYRCHIKAMEESFRILDKANAIEGGHDARIRALITSLVNSVIQDPYGAVLTTDLDSLSPQQRRHYLSLRDRFERGVRKMLEEGMDAGEFLRTDVKLTGFALLGAVNWISHWYRSAGERTPIEIGQFYADLFLRGLRVGVPGSAR